MKVLLIDPPQTFLDGRGLTRQIQPLGLAYVGAALAATCEVRFLLPDVRPYVGDDPWGEIEAAVAAEAPDVVGITGVTAVLPAAIRVAAIVKHVNPETVVVMGGVHASTLPEQTLRAAPDVDVVVIGEGEETMRELVEQIEAGGLDPSVVRGTAFRQGDIVRRSAPRAPLADLDALPFPLRDGVLWAEQLHPVFYQALMTLRGCPYSCVYCAVPSSDVRLTRYRSPHLVVDEIQDLIARRGANYLFFHDSVFTLNRARTVAICEEMIARGVTVPFSCQTRADRVDPELLALLRAAGCKNIFLGIESGDLSTLRKIHKKMTLDTVRTAVDEIVDHGIKCTGFFIVGFPWEDEALIRKTADFAMGLGLDAVSLFSATPLPGTALWDMTAGTELPESIDFRTPQVNLTALSDARYAAIYQTISDEIDAYNRDVKRRKLAARGGAR